MTFLLSYSLFSVLLAKNSHNSCNIVLYFRDLVGVFKLVDCILEAKIEKFALEFFELRGEFSGSHLSEFSSFHCIIPPLRLLLRIYI